MSDEKKPNLGGRPPHEPTEANRTIARTLSAYGVPQTDIARKIGIDQNTLRKYYQDDLDDGAADAHAKVAESLFKKATGDGQGSIQAAIFWAKTRMRWSENNAIDLTNSDGSLGKLASVIINKAPEKSPFAEDEE